MYYVISIAPLIAVTLTVSNLGTKTKRELTYIHEMCTQIDAINTLLHIPPVLVVNITSILDSPRNI